MFELIEASRDGADGAPSATIRATGIAPVYDLANMLAAMTWTPCKQLGRAIAMQTGVRLVSAVILLNEQVDNAREHRDRMQARMAAEHERIRAIAHEAGDNGHLQLQADLLQAINPYTDYPERERADV